MLCTLWRISLLALFALSTTSLSAADVTATPIASEIDNPSGVVVHPATGHLFVASHDGVHRLVPSPRGGSPIKVLEVKGFKTDVYGKGPMHNISALGVALLGDDHLIVGEGSLADAAELVRVFKVGATAPAQPAAPESAAFTLGPIGPGEASAKGEGNFYAIAVGPKAFYVTSNGDDTKGWVLKCNIVGGKPTKLEPFIATKPLVNVDAPVGITMGPKGELVVGQMGEINVEGDSLLTTYDADSGKMLSNAKTGLNDIAGLAYSPKTGKLYAVDYSWMDTKKGGLFQLEVKGDSVTATKVLSLDKPTSLAFDKAGNLYITIFGTPKEGSTAAAGQVLKIAPGL